MTLTVPMLFFVVLAVSGVIGALMVVLQRNPIVSALWLVLSFISLAGMFVLLIVIGAQFYCGMSSVTANSRMIYAFSRDGAIPGSRFWHRINPRTRTPTNSIWLAAVGAFILGLPYLYSFTAYAAVTSIDLPRPGGIDSMIADSAGTSMMSFASNFTFTLVTGSLERFSTEIVATGLPL